MAKRSNEPAVWFLFGLGGFVTAYLLPINILLFGILFPIGIFSWPGYRPMLHLLENPLTRLYIIILCFFGFFHAAHRIRLTLNDFLRIKHLNEAMGYILYGLAGLGSLVAFYYAVMI